MIVKNAPYEDGAVKNRMLKDFSIDAKVKFTDGTVQTQTVVLECEAIHYAEGPRSGIVPFITFSIK